ncbi:hypothetical protein L1987_82454 [Smallanthus sonchifolius]|uniref:Uncharacterized protein n=1 Tax=Smallanthus sonchifolius TaxID=185202 RepID=A0ACB8YEQ2_9ASTR|nr:hypothetical protein L1987_82454 [Smallanthus sonchifolius]
MWLFCHTPQTIQQSHFPLRKRHHPSRLHSHTRHPTSVTLRPSTTNTNHLIQSLCKKGHIKQAIQALTQEPSPTQRTYELLILSCAVANSLSDAVIVNRHLIDDGFDEDPFLETKLINMYSEMGSIEYARKVFDEMSNRTIYVYNAYFQALTRANHGLDVFDLVYFMNTSGIKPDRFTYTYVLKACVASDASVSLLPKGKEIHAHILRHGFETNVHIMTTLVDVYARFGFVSQASHVFN